ncbi:MAG: 50S ribosomal protein L3 [candidate division SR1 bacterium]|nr:50S ribosomal protein L3 [candidate division SR1 bacterium]
MIKGGLIVAKKEMTKMWIDDKFLPVTLVKLIPQEVVRYKTQEKDGYVAAVIGTEKKALKKDKGQKIGYSSMIELKIDEDFVKNHEAGKLLDFSLLEGVKEVDVIGYAIGKGYQGVMKRHHAEGGPKTHGSKFHRHIGSLGNRKPRRTLKGHPHAGHMGTQRVTLQKIQIVDTFSRDDEHLMVLRGSLPGAYNGHLQLIVK